MWPPLERGGLRTRVNWLVRQLRSDASSNLKIDTYFESRSATTSQLLGALIENPDEALLDTPRHAPGVQETLMGSWGCSEVAARGHSSVR